jgi:putrescine aminotransferase
MRHVGDRMIISPPLIIDKEQIDILIERAWKSLDEGMSNVKEKELWESAPI